MEDLLREFFIIALLSTGVAYACHKIKIPSIVGFLITGALFGPYALGLVENAESVNILSEIGIVFLLFTIGMEFSIEDLLRLKKPVLLGGSLQVAITICVFWGIYLWAWPTQSIGSAIFIGFLMALSSTAIVLKTMQQKAMMDSPAGRISLSVLIFQDIVIVPMMLAIPLLAGKADADTAALAFAALRTLVLVTTIFLLARKLVPWLLKSVIRTKNREMFLITTIGICLGTAFLTAKLGLSLSLGAFMAGVVVAESEYSHSALEGILPFRDVFTSIFFISVGMLLDVSFFIDNIILILVITLLVIGIKALIAGGDALVLGYPIRPAIIVGMALCQVGEFSFVLAKEGLGHGLLTADKYQLFLAASILTMAATPFLIGFAPKVADKLSHARETLDEHRPMPKSLNDHLIVIGYGLGGKLLTRAAQMAGIPYTILEMNPDTVRCYAAKGEPILHGDATHPAVLENLGIQRARVLCIVISDPAAIRGITEIARHLNPNIYILVRTRFLGEVQVLKDLGANNVIPEEFETAIEIFTRVLTQYLIPRDVITNYTYEVRAENYDMLRKTELPGSSLGALQRHLPELTVSVFTVEKTSPLEGVTLLEANLRQKANLTVVAVNRADEIFAHPGGNFCLQKNDIVYIFSTPKDANRAAQLFASGYAPL